MNKDEKKSGQAPTDPKPAREPYCEECGRSDGIVFDAIAEWNVDKQEFVLIDTQDAFTCETKGCADGWSKWPEWRDVDANSN